MKIKLGTKCQSNLYGNGTVVDLYDETIPYMFYPIVVSFTQFTDKETTTNKYICFDEKGNTMKQRSDTPDAIFYK